MNISERTLLTAECERLRKEGQSIDQILQMLRARGHSKVESVAAIVPLMPGISAAKQVVHNSPVWADAKERDERILDDL
jgi:hypothetical protein